MSNQVDQIKYIQMTARWVDRTANGGNHDGSVDGNEVSIFVEKLKSAGINDSQKIIDDYNNNKLSSEAKFYLNNVRSDSNVQAAIVASINKTSYLHENKQGDDSYKKITSGIEKSLSGSWGFWGLGVDGEELKKNMGLINKNNVLKVLTKDTKLINNFVSKAKNADIDSYGSTIISALLQAAAERQIDVSNIIVASSKQPKFAVGRDIKSGSVKFGDSATTESALPLVVNALVKAINAGKKLAVVPDSQKKVDKKTLLSSLADKADATNNNGNGNGKVDGDEVTEFKKLAANVGVDINAILDSVRTKSEKKEVLTADEQFVKGIFTTNERKVKLADSNIAMNSAKGVQVGINDGNGDLIGTYIQTVNKDTVLTFLDEINKNNGYKGKIGHKLYESTKGFFGGDNSQQYTAKIVGALIDYAKKNEVDVADIAKKNSDASYLTPDGGNALDPNRVDGIITKLRSRIKEELGE